MRDFLTLFLRNLFSISLSVLSFFSFVHFPSLPHHLLPFLSFITDYHFLLRHHSLCLRKDWLMNHWGILSVCLWALSMLQMVHTLCVTGLKLAVLNNSCYWGKLNFKEDATWAQVIPIFLQGKYTCVITNFQLKVVISLQHSVIRMHTSFPSSRISNL